MTYNYIKLYFFTLPENLTSRLGWENKTEPFARTHFMHVFFKFSTQEKWDSYVKYEQTK